MGADVVVVHPPFIWQRSYASTFTETVYELSERTGIIIAVENMYPWRAPGLTLFRPMCPTGIRPTRTTTR